MALKAWFVDAGDWGAIAYAETRGRAKWIVAQEYGIEDHQENFLAYGCRRAPRWTSSPKPPEWKRTTDSWRIGGYNPEGSE